MKNKFIKKIIIILILLAMVLPFLGIVYAANWYYTDWADAGSYEEYVELPITSLTDKCWADNDARQGHCQLPCIHYPSNTERDYTNQLIAILDINKDGSGYDYATITDRSGNVYSLGTDEDFAKLAYLAYRAEFKGNAGSSNHSYLYVHLFVKYWEYGGIRQKVQSKLPNEVIPMADSEALSNALGYEEQELHTSALSYATSGKTNDYISNGKEVRARIFLFSGDWQQAIAGLFGKDYDPGCDVSVSKEIVNSRYVDRGSEVDFKITVTNNSPQSINLDLTDTFDKNEYELISINNKSATDSEKLGEFKRNITVNGKSGATAGTKEITVKMKVKDNVSELDSEGKPNELTNKVKIDNFKLGSSTGNEIKNSNKNVEDEDYYCVKKYQASINKYIYQVDKTSMSRENDKAATVYADIGSWVYYKIKVSNAGTDTDKYGALKNVYIKDDLENGDYIKEIRYYNKEITYYKDENGNEVHWGDILPSGWSKTDDGYMVDSVGVGASKELCIAFNVGKNSNEKGIVVKNTATITNISNKNGVTLYNNGTNYYMSSYNSNSFKSSDKFTIKMYKVSITKQADKEYVETGDIVKYTITVKNEGTGDEYGELRYILLKDVFDTNELDLHSHSGTNWSWSEEHQAYKYNGKEKPLYSGDTATLTLEFIVDKKSKTNDIITNTATITKILNKINRTIYGTENYMAKGSVFEDSAQATLKTYKVSITKEADKAYVETGDTVIYTITVKNEGSETVNGNIKGIEFKDWHNENEIKYEGIVSGNNWSKTTNAFVYGGTLAPGESTELKLKFTVNKMSKTNDSIKNTVRITKVKNKNDKNFYLDTQTPYGTPETNYMEDGSDFEHQEIVTLKIYTLDIYKSVNAIYDINGAKLDSLEDCEIGDTVEFKIDVSNTGTNSDLDGKVYEVNLSDYYDSRYLQYRGHSDSNVWKKEGEQTSDNLTTLHFKNTSGIDVGQTSTLYVTLAVIAPEDAADLLENVNIANTAEIKTTDKVTNKNNIDIREVLNGKLIDDAAIEILSYHIKVDKYISKVNNKDIAGRDELTIDERFNSPVEVEKTDTIVYTLKLENSNHASLKNIKVVDTIENGILFKETASVRKVFANGTELELVASSVLTENVSGNVVTYTYNDSINAGETLLIDVKYEVVITNMYLYNLENELTIKEVYNRNDLSVFVYLVPDENENKEYVRLKNLIISGTVWLDENKDGLMDSAETRIPGIEVILHDDTNNKVAITTTDADGKYQFGATNGTNADGSESTAVMVEGGDNSGRVIKATGRDDITGNYSNASEYINYYIEFSYNGVQYISTVPYAGSSNIKENNTYVTDYLIDSNAQEYLDIREKFEERFETVSNNKAINEDTGEEFELTFDKNGHESTLALNDGSGISAYSFAIDGKNYGAGLTNGNNIEMLFFEAEGNGAPRESETDYLKYINLGLQEREKVDLRITKDLEYAKVGIKGEELDYDYGQIPKEALYYRGAEGEEDPYELYLYKSDYYYRHDMYANQEVVEALGEDSELEVGLGYKVTITNESPNETNVKIREIIDMYSDTMELKEVTFGEKIEGTEESGSGEGTTEPGEGTEDEENTGRPGREDIDLDGDLTPGTNKPIEPVGPLNPPKDNDIIELPTDPREPTVEVKGINILNQVGAVETLNVSNTSNYNTVSKYDFDGYETVFITGVEDIVLKTGESFDIYLKYKLKKYDGIDGLNRTIDIADKINVVQIGAYSVYEDEECTNPSGLVDMDSNVGNVNTEEVGIEEINLYEDSTFRVVTDLEFKEEDRKISGFVFEDVRSEQVSEEYKEFVGNGAYATGDERNSVLAELFENNKMIRMAEGENILQDLDKDAKLEGMTVQLVELVNIGGVIYEETVDFAEVEKEVGDDFAKVVVQTGAEGAYAIESFTPGRYLVRFRYGDIFVDDAGTETMSKNSLIHNGQDYRSTVYTLKDSAGNILEDSATNEEKYNALIEPNKSDARDNEYRRIEVMSKSEVMTNKVAELMKCINYNNTDIEGLREFSEATESFADTVSVVLGIEKETDIVKRETSSLPAVSAITNAKGNEYIPYEEIESVKLVLPNVDYGVSYRPENFIKLTKKIKEIEVVTSAGNKLVNLEYDMEGKITKKEGIENVQSIDTLGNIQGFRYINMDEELMQGAKISIEYYIIADNIGEVETVNRRLMPENAGGEGGSNAVFNKLYENNAALKSIGIDGEEIINYTRMNELMQATYGENYTYGAFVGAAYYKGKEITEEDKANLAIVPVRVDKLIDWVDNDATFEASNNAAENKHWVATTEDELEGQGLINKNGLFTSEEGETAYYYKDGEGRKYTTNGRKNIAINVDSKEQNPELIKNIYPEISGNAETRGYITIEANGVISAEDAQSKMEYDNVSEVAEFNTVVGRRTNFASTVGNIQLTPDGYKAFDSAAIEADTAGTEIVSLTPPTGLTVFRLFMAYNARILIIIAIVVAILIVVLIAKKYLVGRKKIYK